MFSTPENNQQKEPAEQFSTPIGEQKRSYAEKQKRKKMAEDFQAIVQQRGAVKGKVTRIKNKLQRAEQDDTVPDEFLLRTFLKTIDAAYDEFNTFQNRMYALMPGNAEEQEKNYVEFEELHNEVRSRVCKLLEIVKREENPQGAGVNVNVQPVPIQPQPARVSSSQFLHTPLPTFDGKPENWFKFKAIFNDIINKYPGESDATKLYHLDKCLVDGAAGVLNQQTINDGNFAAAWDFLTQRFEDKRKIIDIHINGLLKLKTMTTESGKQLRDLVDECKRHVEALKFHNYELVGMSDILIVNILASRLDMETRKLWESNINHGDIPTYAETILFLTTRSQVLERLEPSSVSSKLKKVPNITTITKVPPLRTSSLVASIEIRCNFCEQAHPNQQCGEFLKLTPNERYEKAKEIGVCYNCLRKGHITSRCSSTMSCKICKRRHHFTLHLNPTPSPSTGAVNLQITPQSTQQQSVTTTDTIATSKPPIVASCTVTQQRALLCTALVYVNDDSGIPQLCRVLLDCGSQVNIVTEKMASLLRVKRQSVDMKVIGVDGAETRVTSLIKVNVCSRSNASASSIECLVMKKITGIVPSNFIDISTWPIPTDLDLADPEFNRPQRVDLLIGIGHFFGLLKAGKIKLAEGLPYLQETVYGWVVGGLIDSTGWQYTVVRCNVAATQVDLSKLIESFWESEEVSTVPALSSEEVACEEIYQLTHTRDSSGRYIVKLPFRSNIDQLGDSKQHALQRFSYLEKKLYKDPELKTAYCAFVKEYIQLGHCRVIDPSEEDAMGFYLPHHAILKPTSSTTKLRTVFDASAKSTSGLSLNDTLMVGPTIQDPLFDIVLRFRTHAFVFTGDISKMYRMVKVHPDHTKFQRVFWRSHPTEPLRTLELTTVTYGTSSAPYLATRSLMQLALDEGHTHPQAAEIVKNDFYIDDVLTGADTLQELIAARADLEKLLDKGGFTLHKWCSNSTQFLNIIPEDQREKQVSFEQHGVNNIIKTLGLLWNPTSDQFLFCISRPDPNHPVTKRYILSEIAKIFDPLGLLAPVVIIAKFIMRQLWNMKVSWDEELLPEQKHNWNQFRGGLHLLARLEIERHVLVTQRIAVELHAFSDASLEAYGTCIYLRSIHVDNTVEVHLLTSKTRLASKATVPKLELCGFRLMARLVKHVEAALKLEFKQKVMWTDSQIVLWWMRKDPHLLKPYVANRVVEVKKLTPAYDYKYVRTSVNPADLVTRGLYPNALIGNQLWWHGPEYLQRNTYQEEKLPEVEELPELKVTALLATATEDELPLLSKFSSFRKIQRVLAYVIRFANKTRKRFTEGDNSKYPTVNELQAALDSITRLIQQYQLKDDIQEIEKCQQTPKGKRYAGRFRSLNPWLDSHGILRVNGRIKYANVSYEQKCPAILPAQHPVTKLLIHTIHNENLHVGPSGTLSILRQHFWILNGRNAIRSQLRKCIRCFRVNPRETQIFMGDLPNYRVTQAHLFERTGVDFAGPIYVRKGHPRKPVYTKGYVALFVCMVTKCIHIELVSSLTKEAFIAALHRFVGRRGLPSDVYSDNATNFAGASSELHELYVLLKQQQTINAIEEFRMPREIRWHFIPPRSPHVGGLWEAGVKSAKYFIRRTAGETKLTEEEWHTLLVQIEGMLNSRPLIAQSADPSDFNVITPGHLLIGRAINAIPEPAYDNIKPGTLSRWQHIQKMRSDFWKRWSADYLAELQQRQKWNKQHTNIMVGDLVLMKEKNIPPLQWKMGRVVEVHPGRDNYTRVVSLKTQTGVFKRSTTEVAVLPLDDGEMKRGSD